MVHGYGMAPTPKSKRPVSVFIKISVRLNFNLMFVKIKRVSKQVELPVSYYSPMTREPLAIDEAERLARMFKALSDPIRLRLLSMIASHEGGEACVCELTDGGFTVTGPTISHHLKVLREAGLIEGERRGTWVYYRAKLAALSALAAVLHVERPDRVRA